MDECGVCAGDGIPEGACDCQGNVLDECGICGGDGIPQGTCDCQGNILDCAGVCDGDAWEDHCGVCDNDQGNDCGQDCAGEWGGNATEDACNVCDNNPANDNQCIGCTDSDALNYDSDASIDDDSCEYGQPGEPCDYGIYNCDGNCVDIQDWDYFVGNGECDSDVYPNQIAFDCIEFGYEGGDCGENTAIGQPCFINNVECQNPDMGMGCFYDCSGNCIDAQAQTYLGNGYCNDEDIDLSCDYFENDGGDCSSYSGPHRAAWFAEGSNYGSHPQLVSWEDVWDNYQDDHTGYAGLNPGDTIEIFQDTNGQVLEWDVNTSAYETSLQNHQPNWVSQGVFTVRSSNGTQWAPYVDVTYITLEEIGSGGGGQIFEQGDALANDYASCTGQEYEGQGYECWYGFGAYYSGYHIQIVKVN